VAAAAAPRGRARAAVAAAARRPPPRGRALAGLAHARLMYLRRIRRAAFGAAAAGAAGGTAALFWGGGGGTAAAAAAGASATTPRPGSNVPLRPQHRVALCGWPIKGARARKDPRVSDLRSLFSHARDAGYDGCEFGCDDLREMGFFSWQTSAAEIAAHVLAASRAADFPASGGLPSVGALYKITDGNDPPFPGCLEFSDQHWLPRFRQK
jgi:hypothetical protein